MSQRVKAMFTDVDLFEVTILPQRKSTGGLEDSSVQTEVIMAADVGTTTTLTSEAETMTDEVRKVSKSSDATDGGEEGKDDAGETKSKDSDIGNNAQASVSPLLKAMLQRTAPLLEAELASNANSYALKGYPPAPSPLAFGGAADGLHGGAGGAGGASGGSAGSGGSGSGDHRRHVSLRPPAAAISQGLQCTAVGWNAGGGVLVAAYGRRDMGGWCESGGVLCAWPLFRRDFDPNAAPEVLVEHSSCLMCAACHPTQPSLVACGSFNGEVLVYDLSATSSSGGGSSSGVGLARTDSDSNDSGDKGVKSIKGDGGERGDGGHLLFASSIDDYFHREPVRRVRWVWDSSVRAHSLSSVSSDGKVLFWQLQHRLKFPLRGTKLRLHKPVTGLEGIGGGGGGGSGGASSSAHSGGSGGGGGGLRGLKVLPARGAVHGGTCVAFTAVGGESRGSSGGSSSSGSSSGGSSSSSGDGDGGGSSSSSSSGGQPSSCSMLGSSMLVGSEVGAVLAWPPPPAPTAVPPQPATTGSGSGGGGSGGSGGGGMSWDAEARKVLGFVQNAAARGKVCQQVETTLQNSSNTKSSLASRHVSALAVFKAKPNDDALFNGLAGGASTQFEPHSGPVLGLECSPFHRHLFASCGADGALKIGSTLQGRPLMTLDARSSGSSGSGATSSSLHPTGCLTDLSWSPVRPLLLACASASGGVFLYDLGTNTASTSGSSGQPVAHLLPPPAEGSAASSANSSGAASSSSASASGSAPSFNGQNNGLSSSSSSAVSPSSCHSVCFNPRMRAFVAFGDASGMVHVHRMGSSLSYAQPNERAKLDALIASLSEDSTTSMSHR